MIFLLMKTRQDATIRKIEGNVAKRIPETGDCDMRVEGYQDELGENILDLESENEEGKENQGGEEGENQTGAEDQENQSEVAAAESQ